MADKSKNRKGSKELVIDDITSEQVATSEQASTSQQVAKKKPSKKVRCMHCLGEDPIIIGRNHFTEHLRKFHTARFMALNKKKEEAGKSRIASVALIDYQKLEGDTQSESRVPLLGRRITKDMTTENEESKSENQRVNSKSVIRKKREQKG